MYSRNPWCDLSLDDYIHHMRHSEVQQYQAINKIMKKQSDLVDKYNAHNMAILGVTDGNGLEHFYGKTSLLKILAIDINNEYLKFCESKYKPTLKMLTVKNIDLVQTQKAIEVLYDSDLIIANLVVEHIGFNNFLKVISGLPNRNNILSITLQQNDPKKLDENVSKSGYEEAFNDIGKDMHMVSPVKLDVHLKNNGYTKVNKIIQRLPSGKSFLTIEYTKNA